MHPSPFRSSFPSNHSSHRPLKPSSVHSSELPSPLFTFQFHHSTPLFIYNSLLFLFFPFLLLSQTTRARLTNISTNHHQIPSQSSLHPLPLTASLVSLIYSPLNTTIHIKSQALNPIIIHSPQGLQLPFPIYFQPLPQYPSIQSFSSRILLPYILFNRKINVMCPQKLPFCLHFKSHFY